MATTHPELRRPEERGIRSVGTYLLLLGATALLLGLAFPRPGWGGLAHVALVPAACLALRAHHARRLAWTSLLVFSLWWLVMLRWLMPVTGGGYAALAPVMALYAVAALLLIRLIDHRLHVAMIIALPMVWVSLEFLRGHLLAGGFSWFSLAHTQVPFLDTYRPGRLIQTADLFGEYGVGLLVAMTNGLVVDLLHRPLIKPGRAGKRRVSRLLRGAVVLWLVTLGGAWSYGQWRIARTGEYLEPGPRVAVVQTNVPQDNRIAPTAEQEAADWDRLLELTFDVGRAEDRPDLIVWPETVVPAALNEQARLFSPAAEFYEPQVALLVRQLGVNLLAGALAYLDWELHTDTQLGRQYYRPTRRYNSAYLYYPDGLQAASRFDKVHRVPFGEFIPWVDWSPTLKRLALHLTPYDFDYTLDAGEQFTRFEVPYRVVMEGDDQAEPADRIVRIATPICFEDVISRVGRRMVYGREGVKQVDLLVNLTNDGWFLGSEQGPQHVQQAVLRCIENRVPMARAVNTGISGFIDSVGRVGPLVRVEDQLQMVDGTVAHSVELDRRSTLFGRVGQIPMTVVLIVTALLCLGAARSRGTIKAA